MKLTWAWVTLRILLGSILLWAFFDKVFGLGFTTKPEMAWLNGSSPTTGYLKFAAKGPFVDIFKGMAGNPLVDWLFMLGLLLIGVAMILGIGMRVAGYSGAALMLLMYLSAIPPEHHPILDEHIVYGVIFLALANSGAGNTFGLGKWWAKTSLAKQYKFLQ